MKYDKTEQCREISDNLYESNPDHEALIFYSQILNFSTSFSKEDSEKYAKIFKNELDIHNFAQRAVIHELLPQEDKIYTDREKLEKLEEKYNEIKTELEPKTKYWLKKTDDNVLAQDLLDQLEKLYKAKRGVLTEKITKKEYEHPENQVKFQGSVVKTFIEEKKEPIGSEQQRTERLAKLKTQYKEEYLKNKDQLILNQEKVKDFTKELERFVGYHVNIMFGSKTPEFIAKELEGGRLAACIERELKTDPIDFKEISASDDKGMMSVRLKLDLFAKLNVEVSALLNDKKRFFAEQEKEQKEDAHQRSKELRNLEEQYQLEKDKFYSNVKLLEDFSQELGKFIEIINNTDSNSSLVDALDALREKQTEINAIVKAPYPLSFWDLNPHKEDIEKAQLRIDSVKRQNNEASSALENKQTFFAEQEKMLNEVMGNKIAKIKRQLEENQSKIDGLQKQQEVFEKEKILIMNDIASNANMFEGALKQAIQAKDALVSAIDNKVKEDTKTFWEKLPLLGPIVLLFTGEDHENRQKQELLTAQKNEFSDDLDEIINKSKTSSDPVELAQFIEKLSGLNKKIKSLPLSTFANGAKAKIMSNLTYLGDVLTVKQSKHFVKVNNQHFISEGSKNLSEAKELQENLFKKQDELVDMSNKYIKYHDAPTHMQNHPLISQAA